MGKILKILVVDDHPIVREGLKQIVAETPDMIVAGEATNTMELEKKLREDDYDVVLLDISLPGRSGLSILEELKSQKPQVQLLILSIHAEEEYAIRALRSGASGYLTKDSAPEELISAIRKVSTGKKYISSALAGRLAVDLIVDTEKPLHYFLSNREYEVMCMIASGKTIKQVATELWLSAKTVSTHRYRILNKMKMQNNAELTRYAIKHVLVD